MRAGLKSTAGNLMKSGVGKFFSAAVLGVTVYSSAPMIHEFAGEKIDRFVMFEHLFNKQQRQTPQGREALGLLALGTKIAPEQLQKLNRADICHLAKANAIMNGEGLNDAGRINDPFNDCGNSKVDPYSGGALLITGSVLGRDAVSALTEADLCALSGIAGVFGETAENIKNGNDKPARESVEQRITSRVQQCQAGGEMGLKNEQVADLVTRVIMPQIYGGP